MDQRVIEQKIETLRYCVERVARRCPGNPDELASDPDAQDIIALNLARAVQQCVDVGAHLLISSAYPPPDTMGETFERLAEAGVIDAALAERLRKAVGFRNIAVHNYERINWDIVHAVCSRHLDDFRDFARAVLTRLD
ncbi:DUF86 domain-containing protein [Thioalkalivibrio sp. ALE19]|uniref:type VII toxin-antitoxin system HepT family RNase toxin n=1 Tax=Thioalkalivibrio sp. ALE19 TaxID=1266909 RepID=UPI0003FB4E43|nr:DUF86 domain-containing protein [Thioalkalivibrio sp. ALE19]